MKKLALTLLAGIILVTGMSARMAGGDNIATTEPLKDRSLEGVWSLQSARWGTSVFGEGKYKDVTVVKMYSYPRFSFAYFNEKTNTFVGAGGGTYQFDGKTLTEKIEYWSWGTPKYPLSVFKVQFSGEHYTQEGWDNGLLETWKKIK